MLSIFKSKKLTLNYIPPESQIEAARARVDAALDVFAKASNEVSAANVELAILITEKSEELLRAQKVIENAQVHLDLNNKLLVRLDEFRP